MSDKNLVADELRADPRIQQAEALLQAALQDAQAKITGVRPAEPSLASQSEELLSRLAAARGGATYFPYLAKSC